MKDGLDDFPKGILTEKKVYRSPTLFKALSEDMLMGIVVFDQNNILFANPYAIKLFGYTDEQLLEKSWISLFHHDFQSNIQKDTLKMFQGELETSHFEGKISTIDSQECWVMVNVKVLQYGGKQYGIANFYDITEKQKSQEEWESVFDSVLDYIFIIDTNFTILKANKAFKSIQYLHNKEVIGKKCYELIDGKYELCKNCVALKTSKDKKNHVEEWRDPRTNQHYLVSVSPLADDSGSVKSFVHLAKDISGLKQIEKNLKNSLNKQSNLISIVSHELRTPLTAIKGGVDLIGSEFEKNLNENLSNVLKIIQRNINRLVNYINSMLDFQKLESGKVQFKIESNNINDLLTEVYGLMYSLVTHKGIEFKLDLDMTLPMIKMDRDKIIQVVINLINNSIKFTKAGMITIKSKNIKKFVQVTIADTGAGIKSTELPYIFDSFVQFGDPENRIGGSGIGLTICKGIIEWHGGKIWAESEYKKGTCLHFILPLS
ncbi:MAG: PAS domain S-box protein [Caldisericia bacterium]|nr:PAS domain S-box protein [Caldisericia bacterium]